MMVFTDIFVFTDSLVICNVLVFSAPLLYVIMLFVLYRFRLKLLNSSLIQSVVKQLEY